MVVAVESHGNGGNSSDKNQSEVEAIYACSQWSGRNWNGSGGGNPNGNRKKKDSWNWNVIGRNQSVQVIGCDGVEAPGQTCDDGGRHDDVHTYDSEALYKCEGSLDLEEFGLDVPMGVHVGYQVAPIYALRDGSPDDQDLS